MRSLSTLYSIAYGRAMNAQEGDYAGICQLINSLENDGLITLEELLRLRADLKRNKPCMTKHLDFYSDIDFDDEGFYWFPKGNIEIRKRFLHKMIKYSKPWYIKLYYLWKDDLK